MAIGITGWYCQILYIVHAVYDVTIHFHFRVELIWVVQIFGGKIFFISSKNNCAAQKDPRSTQHEHHTTTAAGEDEIYRHINIDRYGQESTTSQIPLEKNSKQELWWVSEYILALSWIWMPRWFYLSLSFDTNERRFVMFRDEASSFHVWKWIEKWLSISSARHVYKESTFTFLSVIFTSHHKRQHWHAHSDCAMFLHKGCISKVDAFCRPRTEIYLMSHSNQLETERERFHKVMFTSLIFSLLF